MNGLLKRLNKQNLSWAFYDWANSAFATTVIAGFFPLFFKQHWSHGLDSSETTYFLGTANSISSLCLALLAPILGSLADTSKSKKNFLGFFCSLGVLTTLGLYFVGQGQWQWAVALYALGTIGFAGGNIFYDALINFVSSKKDLDFISGFGFAIGYLGGGLLFALNVFMVLKPEVFGFDSASEAIKVSFVMVASWWAIFSMPLFINVKEPSLNQETTNTVLLRHSFRELFKTFKEIKKHKLLFVFLIGYLFYIDGVNTVIKMAIDYGMALGFDSNSLIVALLITQFIGFPSAIAFGYLGEKWGAKKAIYLAIFCYAAITVWASFMNHVSEFYGLACAVGLFQGGIQSLSRSFYARLIPEGNEAQYFGFYNMVGKFSAILGPFLVGWVSLKTGNPRLSILVILLFFALGAGFLLYHGHLQRRQVPDSFLES